MKATTEKGRPARHELGANLVEIQRDYVFRILDEVPGRKALIMDTGTTKLISMLVGHSELLSREVYLVEKLENMSKEKDVGTLKTVVLVAPTPQNINVLGEELSCFAITNCYLCRFALHPKISLHPWKTASWNSWLSKTSKARFRPSRRSIPATLS